MCTEANVGRVRACERTLKDVDEVVNLGFGPSSCLRIGTGVQMRKKKVVCLDAILGWREAVCVVTGRGLDCSIRGRPSVGAAFMFWPGVVHKSFVKARGQVEPGDHQEQCDLSGLHGEALSPARLVNVFTVFDCKHNLPATGCHSCSLCNRVVEMLSGGPIYSCKEGFGYVRFGYVSGVVPGESECPRPCRRVVVFG